MSKMPAVPSVFREITLVGVGVVAEHTDHLGPTPVLGARSIGNT